MLNEMVLFQKSAPVVDNSVPVVQETSKYVLLNELWRDDVYPVQYVYRGMNVLVTGKKEDFMVYFQGMLVAQVVNGHPHVVSQSLADLLVN